jgi:hypothetical protein
LLALIAGWTLIASRAPKGWISTFNPATFNHWDAGQYLSIAKHGYRDSTHCKIGPAVHLCGNITWFPGYPAFVRALASIHIGYLAAALSIAWICWYLTLLMVWILSTGKGISTGKATPGRPIRGGTARGAACLALAAVFPGQVYFAALFPISMVSFAVLLCIWLATRTSFTTRTPSARRSLFTRRSTTAVRTGVAGIVAGLAYPLAVAAAPALLLTAAFARNRQRRVTMLAGAAAVVGGFGLVLAYAQLRVGKWNAYFISEREEYGVRGHNPLHFLVARWHQFLHPSSSISRTITQQGALATLLVVVAIVVTVPALVRVRRATDLTDLALLVTACISWLIPYVGGGQLSIYRSEACLIVLVPLLRRLPVWVIAALAGGAAVIAYNMAPLFFSGVLI